MLDIVEHLKKHLNISDSAFVGLFLYGSQNYGLSDETSDSDYICVVTDFGLTFNTVHAPHGQIKVYNLHYFMSRLLYGDLECLECLYSDYVEINPRYQNTFARLIADTSTMINLEGVKMALNKKLAEHLSFLNMPKTGEDQNAFYSKKRLYWAIRVADQLSRITAGESFAESLKYPVEKREELLAIKTNEGQLNKTQLLKLESELKSCLLAQEAAAETNLFLDNSLIFKTEARLNGLKHMADTRKS